MFRQVLPPDLSGDVDRLGIARSLASVLLLGP